ncbi:hypothetical protein [Mucilaginibacter humi]|nr:hypothetical protein [Mucilaginibacter humi]
MQAYSLKEGLKTSAQKITDVTLAPPPAVSKQRAYAYVAQWQSVNDVKFW